MAAGWRVLHGRGGTRLGHPLGGDADADDAGRDVLHRLRECGDQGPRRLEVAGLGVGPGEEGGGGGRVSAAAAFQQTDGGEWPILAQGVRGLP